MRNELLQWLFLACRRWQQRRDTLRQLQSLDDRMLKDIGLHRTELLSAVEEWLPGATVPYCLRRRAFLHPAPAACPGTAPRQDNERPDYRPAA